MFDRVSTIQRAGERIANGYDSVEIALHYGRTIYIQVERDDDQRPQDSDCYSAEDIERWKNDEWSYCGIIVKLSGAEASLWGIERGFKDDETQWFTEHLESLVLEVMAELKTEIQQKDMSVRAARFVVEEFIKSRTVEAGN